MYSQAKPSVPTETFKVSEESVQEQHPDQPS